MLVSVMSKSAQQDQRKFKNQQGSKYGERPTSQPIGMLTTTT